MTFLLSHIIQEQGRKRPLDTSKRMIERREREGEREKERQKERYREWGRDKREREKEWKRERERERERWKARRVNPTLRLMLPPKYVTRACKKGRRTPTVPSLREKSSWNLLNRKIKRKERLNYEQKLRGKIIRENYQWKLSVKIITKNYDLVYQWRRKVEIYRDTGVFKIRIYKKRWGL